MPRTRKQLFDGLKLECYSALNTYSSTIGVLSNGDLEVNSSGTTIFKYNSTELARLTSAGSLALGVQSPISYVHLVDTVNTAGGPPNGSTPTIGVLIGASITNTVLNLGVDATGTAYSWIQSRSKASASYLSLSLQPYGGNVGIGTTTTSALLHILSTTEIFRQAYDSLNYVSNTISSNGSLSTVLAGSKTSTVFTTKLQNTCTSSSNSINKIGGWFDITGSWTGTNAQIWATYITSSATAPIVRGVNMVLSGATSSIAGIEMDIDGSAGTNAYGIYISCYGAATNNNALHVADGNVYLGVGTTTSAGPFKTNSSLITSSTSGFFYLSAVAGTPSGAATTFSGLVPLVYDSNNNLLYAYSNSAWRQTGPSLPISITNGGTGNTTFTSNGVVYYNSGGSALTNGSGFLFDGTNAAIGTSINSSYRFLIDQSGAKTTAIYAQYISNSCTSSTANIIKYGQYLYVSGDWTGTGSAEAIGSRIDFSLTANAITGIYVSSFNTTTNGTIAFQGIISGAGTNNYGIYLSAAGGTNNYGIWVNAGICYFGVSAVITNTSLGTSSTSGFFYLSSVSGTPSGAATTVGGSVPLLYDSSAHKLWAYSGSWRSVALT